MKQFFKILFACFFALVLFVVVAVLSLTGLVAGLSAGSEKKVIEDHSVLVIDLNEQIEEQGKDNTLSALSGNDERVCGLNEMIRSLKHAATDDQVDGVYIRTGVCNSGWASLKEMREALSEFRKSGKFVMAYGELTDQKSYYVASAADQVYLNPAGMFEFKGLAINGTFFKGALDKLDIQTEAFHCGKFKGAYEPFKLEKFSEPNRYQLGVLLQDMYG
ncbi:MAG TPA: S49 family peptidase, partial [Chitinophagaceae bacterium]|nr:S49 family peptidase [Chitinophagaceae bacterium]